MSGQLGHPLVYAEDLVEKVVADGSSKIGVVQRVGWVQDSDAEDSDVEAGNDEWFDQASLHDRNSNGGQKNNDMDDDSDDDAWSLDSLEREELELERKALDVDKVRIAWQSGDPSFASDESPADIHVLDHYHVPGDVVFCIADRKKIGTVVDSRLTLDIQLRNDEKLIGVPMSEAEYIHPFVDNCRIVYNCTVALKVRFQGGNHVGTFLSTDKLVPDDDPDVIDLFAMDDHMFHPGQNVTIRNKSTLDRAKWHKGRCHTAPVTGVVESVIPHELLVKWALVQESDDEDGGISTVLVSDAVAPVNHFAKSAFQLGDRVMINPETRAAYSSLRLPHRSPKPYRGSAKGAVSDTPTCGSEGASSSGDSNDDRLTPQVAVSDKGHEADDESEISASTTSTVSSSSSTLAAPNRRQQKRRERRQRAKQRKRGMPVCGVICNYQRVCDVQWQDGSIEKDIRALDLFVYDSPMENDFWPEDFVVKVEDTDGDSSINDVEERLGVVLKADFEKRICTVRWLDNGNEAADQEETVSSYCVRNHPLYEYRLGEVVCRLPQTEDVVDLRNWAGEVIEFKQGKFAVKWIDGTITEVNPHEVTIVDMEDEDFDSDGSEFSDEDVDDEFNETDQLAMMMEDKNIGVVVSGDNGAETTNNDGDRNDDQRWWAENDNTSLFDARGRVRIVGDMEMDVRSSTAQTEDAPTPQDAERVSTPQSSASASTPSASISEQISSFRIVEDVSNHHFASEVYNTNANFAKCAAREMRRLQSSLPANAMLVVFEERLDLLRLLIVGSKETPYEDCLFVFDIFLPSSFPADPPKVYFHSGVADRLHPNLYPEGRVCLSLLGTWSGKGVEMWDPTSSNLLQLIVSIQGLLLGQLYPYYMEPGYETQKNTLKGHRAALLYNEQAVLLTVKSMINMIRHPTPHFEDVVRAHFRERGEAMLRRLHSYAEDPKDDIDVLVEKDLARMLHTTLSTDGKDGDQQQQQESESKRVVCGTEGFRLHLKSLLIVLAAEILKL